MNRSVYVVASQPGPVKIGASNKPKHRFGSLCTASAVPLELAFVGDCDHAAAKQIEARAHEILAKARVRGEWFDATVAAAVDAIMKAASDLGFEVRAPQPAAVPGTKPVEAPKKRGRPPTGAKPVLVRLLPDDLAQLDTWIEEQSEKIGRPEAIRRIIQSPLFEEPR